MTIRGSYFILYNSRLLPPVRSDPAARVVGGTHGVRTARGAAVEALLHGGHARPAAQLARVPGTV